MYNGEKVSMENISKQRIYELLRDVKDPEIPVLSLVDLGVITAVDVVAGHVTIEMTPTFVGCPALEMMQHDMREVLMKEGISDVDINISYKRPWNSDMITEQGRQALRKFGLAPPPARHLFIDLDVLEHVDCPRCGHSNTELRNTFGPTLCRSIHYCNDCREAFEQFKPL